MVSRETIASVRVKKKYESKVELNNHWHLDGADCCLIGIVLGVRTTKNIPQ